MSYQKVYMNQIHSSSLLCQLAQMWKTQLLCDAVIKTGSVITKAHRVVLVAACPMLQSMNDATSGSHLEVRLAADIKQESINTFLQYLYEGFMMLTEENVQDVEKVARLLQVDGVIKCCADFHKCIQRKTGTSSSQYKYTFNDLVEFRHVRVSDLQRTMHERMTKRSSEMSRPASPGSKRPRMHHQGGPDDTISMSRGYYSGGGGGGGPPDPWDRVPQLGSGMSRTGRPAEPGVIEIMEESIELVQTDPPDKGGRGTRPDPKSAKSVSISVASQLNSNTDLRVVNVTSDTHTTSVGGGSIPSAGHSGPSQRGSITVSPLNLFGESNSSSSQSSMPLSSSSSLQKEKQYSSSHPTKESGGRSMESPLSSSQRQNIELMKQRSNESHSGASPQRQSQSQQPYPVSMPVPAGPSSSSSQSKPYAAGSAVQASDDMTPPSMSPNISRSSSGPSRSHSQSSMSSSPYSTAMPIGRAQQHHMSESPSGPGGGGDKNSRVKEESDISSTADLTPDLSIVKVEGGKSGLEDETGGLDMYVDTHDGTMHLTHMGDDETSDQEYEAPGEWGQESNEGSNISGDQNNSWMAASGSGSFQEKLADIDTSMDYTQHLISYLSEFPTVSENPLTTSTNNSLQTISFVPVTTKKYGIALEYCGTHKLVHIDGRKKTCRHCSSKKRKTAKGYPIETSFKCEQCDLALCRVGCFTEYHSNNVVSNHY